MDKYAMSTKTVPNKKKKANMSLLLCKSGYGATKDSPTSPSTPSITPSYSTQSVILIRTP